MCEGSQIARRTYKLFNKVNPPQHLRSRPNVMTCPTGFSVISPFAIRGAEDHRLTFQYIVTLRQASLPTTGIATSLVYTDCQFVCARLSN